MKYEIKYQINLLIVYESFKTTSYFFIRKYNTAVGYSFYISYYISAFSIYYPSGAPAGGSSVTIIAGSTVAAAVVVKLIKIQSRKQAISEQESEIFE